MKSFTPEQHAELLASAERKKLAAERDTLNALANMPLEQLNDLPGFQFTYTLTPDEYRAMLSYTPYRFTV